ncbi:hypothetical protein BaRGS_00018595 [Batillaria attramentaria]|uniref:Uncharacterized protein n=1 Tax=Batillaria attramentaria TaxID=370345 RepID=A0ABD0KSU6_9CAEN
MGIYWTKYGVSSGDLAREQMAGPGSQVVCVSHGTMASTVGGYAGPAFYQYSHLQSSPTGWVCFITLRFYGRPFGQNQALSLSLSRSAKVCHPTFVAWSNEKARKTQSASQSIGRLQKKPFVFVFLHRTVTGHSRDSRERDSLN